MRINYTFLVALFILFTKPYIYSQSFEQIQKLNAPEINVYDLYGISVSIDGNYAIVGAEFEDEDSDENNTIENSGSAYIYEKDISTGTWNFIQKLTASDRCSRCFFGAVGISGEYAIVGAYKNDNYGSVYVYKRGQDGQWKEIQKLTASDRGNDDWFGRWVSINDNYIIISSPLEDTDELGNNTLENSGSVYIFKRDISTEKWNQVQKIVASDRERSDGFGSYVSIDGDFAVIGAYNESHDILNSNYMRESGSAYIFEKDINGSWNQVQKIIASDRSILNHFGARVSISGNYLIVSAVWNDTDSSGDNYMDDSGSAYIFERNREGSWVEIQKIVASDRSVGKGFGNSVAIEGDYILVSADFKSSSSGINYGKVYIFQRDNNNIWKEDQILLASDKGVDDNFGIVDISDNSIIVGAYLDDVEINQGIINDSGSAYIFKLNQILGVDDVTLDQGFNLYPNPVSNILTIESKLPLKKIEVFSIFGQRVKEVNSSFNSISVKNLSRGIYIIRIYSENGTIVRKLIKQ